jgi:hypothetical protein
LIEHPATLGAGVRESPYLHRSVLVDRPSGWSPHRPRRAWHVRSIAPHDTDELFSHFLVNFVIYLDVISLLNITLKYLLFIYLCANLERIGQEKNVKEPSLEENAMGL